ncbi:MAG: transposase, partial [Solirubrobacteraceae bacterium MAG38_C4-C5]|nr:transposase [Candidatus Siliceabacter maunaloa]
MGYLLPLPWLRARAMGHPQAGVDYPSNWHELLAWFPDDAACLRYLERLRWSDGFVCRFCGVIDGGWWQKADGLRRCKACRHDTSVTAGTILVDDLRDAIQAVVGQDLQVVVAIT